MSIRLIVPVGLLIFQLASQFLFSSREYKIKIKEEQRKFLNKGCSKCSTKRMLNKRLEGGKSRLEVGIGVKKFVHIISPKIELLITE